jgi:acetyl-CoA synthetase
MTVECVVAYLGVVSAGGAVVSIADSFSPPEVEKRLRIAGADAIVTVQRFRRGGKGIELYDKAVEAGAPPAIVIPDGGGARLRPGDVLWDHALAEAAPLASIPGEPERLTNILFSSGTTGTPKAIPWTHLTPIKCATDGYFHQDIQPGDVVAWPTNIGWMMGPWLIYASLVNGAAMALFEGAPTGAGFARFVERARVTVLGVVPSLVRAWRASGSCEGTDWSRIRVLTSTGEPSSPEDYLWLMSRTGYRAPVIEYCGGTEIGGGYITGTLVQPASPATFTTPALGLDLVVLDDAGRPVGVDEAGEVFLVPPSIGLSERLLNRNHHEVYFAGCPAGPEGSVLRRHGDMIVPLAGGFFKAAGRADDTMNLGGIKVSSTELERVLEAHPQIVECAAVGVPAADGGAERLVVFAVLDGSHDHERLCAELGALVARRLNPLFRVSEVVSVDSLPRTASNKVMRRVLRQRVDSA